MDYITGKPNILDINGLTKKIQTVLESGILTNSGPKVQELEEKFTKLFGVSCIAYSSATLALEALAKLRYITETFYTPSFSFIATATCTKGYERFLDIDEYYQPIIEPYNTQISGIATNLFGSCSPRNLEADIKTYIFDNAHGIGVKYKGKPIAQYSDYSVYSLHSTKFLNSIEGGIIACKNELLLEPLKQYRNFGYKTDSPIIYSGEIESFGTNAKMSELHATVGLHNLKYLEFLISINEERYNWYKKYLPEQCKLITYPESVEPNYSYIIIRVPAKFRDKLCDYLYKEGIFVKQYFTPIHKLSIFNSNQSLPNTEKIATEVIALPQGIQLKGEKDVYYICNKVTKFFKVFN